MHNQIDMDSFLFQLSSRKKSFHFFVRNRLIHLFVRNFKPSAVLILFSKNSMNQFQILLTKRSPNLKDHPGQISFPGGKKKLTDKNIFETALRETKEEIGIHDHKIKVIGSLPKIFTLSGYEVIPVLAVLTDPPNYFNQNVSSEVDEIFQLPLNYAFYTKNYNLQKVRHRFLTFQTASIGYKNYYIWGITAEILFYMAKFYKKKQSITT